MITRRIVLKFPHSLVEQPIIYNLVKSYDLKFSILKAFIMPNQEGLLVLELSGENKNYTNGIKYIKNLGVNIQPLTKDVVRNEKKCTHCGACVVICPVTALVVDHKTKKVLFHADKCIGCELCVKPCPPRAMEVHF